MTVLSSNSAAPKTPIQSGNKQGIYGYVFHSMAVLMGLRTPLVQFSPLSLGHATPGERVPLSWRCQNWSRTPHELLLVGSKLPLSQIACEF